MNFNENIPALKPLKRGVSIIGIGATPFTITKDDPDLCGISEGELFGYAAREAMADAGLDASQVEFYVHGQAGPGSSNFATPNMHVANWCGMKGKGSFHHSEACCTGYVALETAVNYVASGMYDIVLTGGVEMAVSMPYPTRVLTQRTALSEDKFHEVLCSTIPRDYAILQRSSAPMGAEGWLDRYIRENKLDDETVDRVLTAMAINLSRASALNPLSLNFGKTYDDMARAFKMASADEFLHSKFNPKLGRYVRANCFEQRADGAGALIVCASDIAHKFTSRPVEVLAIGHSCIENSTPALEKFATERAYQQVKQLTGLTGADMDLFMTNDFFMQSGLLSAEACEYLPKGEGWKYVLEGRTAFDGDRPYNTNGGRCSYGHAAAASGLHDHYEAIRQMRGEMGATQVKHPVKYAMLRGFGGGQNVTCTILKNNG